VAASRHRASAGDGGDRSAQQPFAAVDTALICGDSASVSNETGFVEGQTSPSTNRWLTVNTIEWRGSRPDLVTLGSGTIVFNRWRVIGPGGPRRANGDDPDPSFATGRRSGRAWARASLNRPGRHITVVSTFLLESEPKRPELLRELRPHARTIAILVNPVIHPPRVESQVGDNSCRRPQASSGGHDLNARTIRDKRGAGRVPIRRFSWGRTPRLRAHETPPRAWDSGRRRSGFRIRSGDTWGW